MYVVCPHFLPERQMRLAWMSWLQAFFMGNWKSMFSAMRTSWSNSVALHS